MMKGNVVKYGQDNIDTDVIIKQKNIFQVNINKNGQLLADDNLIDLNSIE